MTAPGTRASEPQRTRSLDELRQLVLAAFAARGLRRVAEYPHPDGIDLVFETTVLTDVPRQAIARVCAGRASERTLADLRSSAIADQCIDHLLVAQTADEIIADDNRVISGQRLDRLLIDTWTTASDGDGDRAVDRDVLKLLGRISLSQPVEARPLLRATLALSRNRLPTELTTLGTADDLFERYVFALLTGVLHLDGHRYGSAAKGKRVGDALIGLPRYRRPVVLDCKAAAMGYLMNIADERKLIEYATSNVEWGSYSGRPAGVVVISGSFQGARAAVHPFGARTAAFEAASSKLWYVRIDDLIAAILSAPRELWHDTERIRSIDWCQPLSDGVVSRSALIAALQGAVQ